MKNLTIICLALSLLSCSASESVILYDLDDVAIEVTQKNKRWYLINYWADWCTPCLKEIPALNSFEASHSDLVKVIGVHSDALAVSDLKQIVEKLNIQFSVLKHDPRYELGLPSVQALPTTYLISPEGKILGPFLGAQSEASLSKMILKS